MVVSGHYLVGVACSRGANFLFWYHGYPELAPTDLTKMNIPGYAVITAHVIQFMLLVGFLIIYIANFPLCRIFTSLRGTRSPTTPMNGTAEDSKAGKSDAGEVGAELLPKMRKEDGVAWAGRKKCGTLERGGGLFSQSGRSVGRSAGTSIDDVNDWRNESRNQFHKWFSER